MDGLRRRLDCNSPKCDESGVARRHDAPSAKELEQDVSRKGLVSVCVLWSVFFGLLWSYQLGDGVECLCLRPRGNSGLRWNQACFIEHQQLLWCVALYLSTWSLLLVYRLSSGCSWEWTQSDVTEIYHCNAVVKWMTRFWCAPGYADSARGLYEVRLSLFMLGMLCLSGTNQSSLPHVVYAPKLYRRRLKYQGSWPANLMMVGLENDQYYWVSVVTAATLSVWLLATLLLLVPRKLREGAGVQGLLEASLYILCAGYIYLQALIQGLMSFAIEADGRENFAAPPRLLGREAVLDCSHSTVLSASVMLGVALAVRSSSSRTASFLRRWVLSVMGVFYFNSAVAKLVESGWPWVRGDILQKLVEAKGHDRLYNFFHAHGVGILFGVLEPGRWYTMLSCGTLAFELFLALFALLDGRWILIFCLVVFTFHYSIIWIMGVHFDYHMVFLLLLIPWPQEYGSMSQPGSQTQTELDRQPAAQSWELLCASAGFVTIGFWLGACHNGPFSAQGHRGGDLLWPVTSAPLFAYPPGHKFQGSVFNAMQKP